MKQNQRLNLNQKDDSSEISSSGDGVEEGSVGDEDSNDEKSNQKQVNSEHGTSSTPANVDSAKTNDNQNQATKD